MITEEGFVYIENARLSFPTLITPKAFSQGQPEKYSADFIVPLDSESLRDFRAEGVRLAQEKWGEKAAPIIEMIKQTKKLRAFGIGSERLKSDGTMYDGYEDMAYIGGSTSNKPDLYDNNGKKLMDAGKLYGGCYVNAFVKPWIQDNKFGKAIRCDLIAIQFVKDGDSFGAGRPNTEGMFKPVEGAPAPVDEVANYDW
jgi:hypothetical protein